MKLRSNTILITGGAGGIGYELTKQLTALDNTILITGRDQAKMDRAKAAFPKIHTFQSDVSDPKAIATLYEEVTKQFPELNILINNAGIMREINVHDKAGSLEDITPEPHTPTIAAMVPTIYKRWNCFSATNASGVKQSSPTSD